MQNLNSFIKNTARETGFTSCGICLAEPLQNERKRLDDWISNGFHAEMDYLSSNPHKRLDPKYLLEEVKTIITLAYYYAPNPDLIPASPFKIARFALGKDYHFILKDKTQELVDAIQLLTGPFRYRIVTDSAPLPEKAWAVKSGMGWIGKNTLLQIPGKGSWFLLSEILTDLTIEPDLPFSGQHCGNCNRCIEACPAGAIIAPYILDARKCLSYLTYEKKGGFPPAITLHGCLYGCDICQEVCPFNQTPPPVENSWLVPNPALAAMSRSDWHDLDEHGFNTLFRDSGIKRGGYARLVRNLKTINP